MYFTCPKWRHFVNPLVGCFAYLLSLPVWAQDFDATKLFWDESISTVYTAENGGVNIYTLLTDNPLRDSDPSGSQVRIYEHKNGSYHRSSSRLFDALYALAVQEGRQNSVSEISDWAFDRYACSCFETGKKWNYVWTRDTAYSIDLAMGQIDPERALNSLVFKLSPFRDDTENDKEFIVQDTGTGGSWPVSSDRVVWALGAEEVLKYLSDESLKAELPRIFQALDSTLTLDRETVFDSRDGLYRGEQSFLDWREQSYPQWTAKNVTHIAMSKSLSTNVLHYASMKIAATLARKLQRPSSSTLYEARAKSLKLAIQKGFWLNNKGLFSALKVTELDSSAVEKFDLLGLSLAIIWEVATPEQAKQILKNYPHTAAGAPVIWPELPNVSIYHNRAIWPFVSSYWLKAAQKQGNAEVFTHNAFTLIRGAALNLSNMENFEFLTLSNWFDDGNFSGPVINSQRQLWSVAGYLSMVIDGIYGKEATMDGLRFQPFLPEALRRALGLKGRLSLNGFAYKGKLLDITLKFPDNLDLETAARGNIWVADSLVLNGNALPLGTWFTPNILQDKNKLTINLINTASPGSGMKVIPVKNPYQISPEESLQLLAPKEPKILSVDTQGVDIELHFDGGGQKEVLYNVYRNGSMIAANVNAEIWRDSGAGGGIDTLCYAVEAENKAQIKSHHSEPVCLVKKGSIQEFLPNSPNFIIPPGTTKASDHGRLHFNDWGFDGQILTLTKINVKTTGWYYLQAIYSNAGPINTGVTAAAKKIDIIQEKTGKIVDQGVVIMPHTPDWETWGESTLVPIFLSSGQNYRLVLRNHTNMSYLKHFEAYKGRGGEAGSVNRVNLGSIKLIFSHQASERN